MAKEEEINVAALMHFSYKQCLLLLLLLSLGVEECFIFQTNTKQATTVKIAIIFPLQPQIFDVKGHWDDGGWGVWGGLKEWMCEVEPVLPPAGSLAVGSENTQPEIVTF